MRFNCKIKEQTNDTQKTGKRFRAILLQEGLGNLSDAYYYTKEALQSAIPVFEAKKIFADHPSRSEDNDRPERSVRDSIGHYENVSTMEENGCTYLIGDVVMVDDPAYGWARAQMKHALEYSAKYPDKDYMGLSINADGDITPSTIDEVMKIAPMPCQEKLLKAKELGIMEVKITQRITDAVSCDLVTQAGAGGKFLTMLEEQMDPKAKQADTIPTDHPDASKDVELIKSMIDKYLKDDEGEETEAEVKRAAAAYEDMGLKGEEAFEAAAKHVKAAKSMSKKQSEDEAAKKEEEAKKQNEASEDETEVEKCEKCGQPLPKTEDETESEDEVAKKEAAKKEEEVKKGKKESAGCKHCIVLVGKVAKLEAELAKHDLNVHMEKTLSESKLPRSATKKFRESFKGKNKSDFDGQFKMFIEAYNCAIGSEASGGNVPEKQSYESGNSGFDFSNCRK